jgi:ribosome maturation factor RimP
MPPASADRRSGPSRPSRGPNPGGSAALRARLLELLGPVVATTGHDLEDVTVTAAGRRSLIRVIVDADGGVDLDAVADVSRAVSDALDEGPGGGAFAGPYVLEVSSPGVDRPLTEPRHWRRAVGRLVQVTVGEQQLIGRIVDAGESGIGLEVAGERRDVSYAELGAGRVQVEFQHAAEPDDADDTANATPSDDDERED